MNKKELKVIDKLIEITKRYKLSKEDYDEIQILKLIVQSTDKIHHKGEGRIVILSEDENDLDLIKKVKQAIKAVDQFEIQYLPKNFISIKDEWLVYSSKFEIDCEKLIRECYNRGIEIKILSKDFGECPI